MFVPNDTPPRDHGQVEASPKEFQTIQVPRTSLDPSEAVEKELQQRQNVEVEDEFEQRRFAVYKHQTESDLQYER